MINGVNYKAMEFIGNHLLLLISVYVAFFFIPFILRNVLGIKVLDHSIKVFSRALFRREYDESTADIAIKYIYRKHTIKSVLMLLGVLSAITSIGFLILYLIIFGNFNPSLEIIGLIKTGNIEGSELTKLESVLKASNFMSSPVNWFAVISQILLTSVVLIDAFDTDQVRKESEELRRKFNDVYNELLEKDKLKR